jgi:hypothetical protein
MLKSRVAAGFVKPARLAVAPRRRGGAAYRGFSPRGMGLNC